MTTSLKKLLLVSITLLLGVMSDGVMAQTVTHIAGNEYSYNGVNYDISYVYAKFSNSTDAAQLKSQPWFFNQAVSSAFVTAVGSSLTATAGNSGTSGPYFAYSDTGGYNFYSYYLTDHLATSFSADTGAHNYAVLTLHSVGAPEIDGSLAPKVGFLLGCLFLMFGRKKQNTEALLTA